MSCYGLTDFLDGVGQTIADALEDVDEEKLVAHIAVLSEFAHVAPDAFEEQSEAIMTFLVKKVLMTPAPMDPVSHFSPPSLANGQLTNIYISFTDFSHSPFMRFRVTWTPIQNGWKTII